MRHPLCTLVLLGSALSAVGAPLTAAQLVPPEPLADTPRYKLANQLPPLPALPKATSARAKRSTVTHDGASAPVQSDRLDIEFSSAGVVTNAAPALAASDSAAPTVPVVAPTAPATPPTPPAVQPPVTAMPAMVVSPPLAVVPARTAEDDQLLADLTQDRLSSLLGVALQAPLIRETVFESLLSAAASAAPPHPSSDTALTTPSLLVELLQEKLTEQLTAAFQLPVESGQLRQWIQLAAPQLVERTTASTQESNLTYELTRDGLVAQSRTVLSASLIEPAYLNELISLARRAPVSQPVVSGWSSDGLVAELTQERLAAQVQAVLEPELISAPALGQLLMAGQQRKSHVALALDANDSLTAELWGEALAGAAAPALTLPVIEQPALKALTDAAATKSGALTATSGSSYAVLEDLYRGRFEADLLPVLNLAVVSREGLGTLLAVAQTSESPIAALDTSAFAAELLNDKLPALTARVQAEVSPSVVANNRTYVPVSCAPFVADVPETEVEYDIGKNGTIVRKVHEKVARSVSEYDIKVGDSLRKTLALWYGSQPVFWEASRDVDFTFKAPAAFGRDRQKAVAQLFEALRTTVELKFVVYGNNVAAVQGVIPDKLCR